MDELHVFTDDDGIDTVIAESAEDAMLVWLEQTWEPSSDHPNKKWIQRPDMDELTVVDNDGEWGKSGRGYTRTCQEWAASQGRGFLCSSEY
jgi:hypothetical protein